MYGEELTIGSQEWINKSDWSVFLCWLVLAVRVKNRSWSVKSTTADRYLCVETFFDLLFVMDRERLAWNAMKELHR